MQSAERKINSTKNSVSIKMLFLECWRKKKCRDRDFPILTKAEGVYHQQPWFTRNDKERFSS